MNATPTTEDDRCPVAWCDQTHTPGRPSLAHRRTIGPIPGPGQVTVKMLQPEHHGALADPFVMVVYQVGTTERAIPLPPAEAGDLADMLAGVDPSAVATLADALTHACRHLIAGGAR